MRRELSLLLSLLLLGPLVDLAAPGRATAQGFIIPELGARKNGTGAAIGRPDEPPSDALPSRAGKEEPARSGAFIPPRRPRATSAGHDAPLPATASSSP